MVCLRGQQPKDRLQGVRLSGARLAGKPQVDRHGAWPHGQEAGNGRQVDNQCRGKASPIPAAPYLGLDHLQGIRGSQDRPGLLLEHLDLFVPLLFDQGRRCDSLAFQVFDEVLDFLAFDVGVV